MKAFLFDMDGVLLDSEKIFVRSLKRYLEDQGISEGISQDRLSKLTGMKTDAISKQLMEEYGLHKELGELSQDQDVYFEKELEKIGALEPMEGLEEFLKSLKEKNFLLALASSSDKGWVHRVLTELRVEYWFDQIVTGDQVSVSKPEPDIFLLAAKKLGVKPEDCVVIEDSVNGIKAGKRAGMYVVGYKGSEIFQDTKEADEEIASFSQLNIDRFLEPPSKIN